MATDLSDLIAQVQIALGATAKRSVDFAVPEAILKLAKTLKFRFGTGANQVNQIFWDRRTLAASAGESLDLAGTLTNPFGQVVTFAAVKAILILNRSDETLDEHTATDAVISVGDTAANEFVGPFDTAGDGVKVPAGGCFLVTNPTAAGWTVTAGTGDLLDIQNDDGADEALYDVVILGKQA